MSIYKQYTKKELKLLQQQTFDVYVAVFGLRFHVQTTAASEKEAERNAIHRLGAILFRGKSAASYTLEIKSFNPVFHTRRPDDWDIKTIKEIS